MAASDAKPVPQKNVAYRVTFPILDADGDLVTGAASLDSEVSLDGAQFADCTNEATEISVTSGIYFLDLTSAEMNADTVALIVKTGTAGAKTTTIIMYPEETGDIRVNVTAFGGTAGTFSGGRPEVNTSHAAGTAWNSGSIGAATLASDTITATKLAVGVIEADAFAAGAINAAAIADNAIDAGAIAADAITAAKIADGAIDAATFAAGAINAAAIASDAITATKLAVGVIEADAFAAGAITAASIANDAITDAKVAADVTIASVTGAVGSVTGNVGGNVAGSVGSVTAAVTVGTNNDKTGYELSAAMGAAMTEGYAADGATATPAQMLYMIWSMLAEKNIASTTLTAKKLDGTTTAMTFTLDSDTAPTSVTRAT